MRTSRPNWRRSLPVDAEAMAKSDSAPRSRLVDPQPKSQGFKTLGRTLEPDALGRCSTIILTGYDRHSYRERLARC